MKKALSFIFALLSFFTLSMNIFAGGPRNKIAQNKLPIIYHRSYNISMLGLEYLHPFESHKYGKVHKYLIKECGLKKESFYKPEMVLEQDLLLVHTKEYLDSLRNVQNVLRITELSVFPLTMLMRIVPRFIWHHFLIKPLLYATGGTVLGTDLAIKHGFSINLSGGYHHARKDLGEGFCVFADIQLAVHKILEQHPNWNILIVDLDAHQGNGHERDFIDNDQVKIFDIYMKGWPQDSEARRGIDFDYCIPQQTSDEQYLDLLRRELPKAIAKTNPDFIIYNAGTDILAGDNVGHLNVSEEGIIKRDEIVFKNAVQNNIPIEMLLSGGYTKRSAPVIGKSIKNLIYGCLWPLVLKTHRKFVFHC